MKKILRPILCGGVLAALLCTPSLAAEQGDFSLLVNGEPVAFTDAAPVLKDGRSFLPVATTFQALGFAQEDIVWNGETQSVTCLLYTSALYKTYNSGGRAAFRTPGRVDKFPCMCLAFSRNLCYTGSSLKGEVALSHRDIKAFYCTMPGNFLSSPLPYFSEYFL